MKKNALLTLCGLTLLGVALSAPSVLAEPVRQKKPTTTTTTTMNRSGFVSDVGPDIDRDPDGDVGSCPHLSVHRDHDVRRRGREARRDGGAESGVPVTVYYSKSGDKMVAAKVVVKETETQPSG